MEASIFVMPSLCEPFGLVFLEAMAYALPCIGTRIDAMPEIITDGETGFLVTPKNVNDLAEKIITLLKNVRLLESMGEKGSEKVQMNFRWEDVGKKVDEHLLLSIGKGAQDEF